MTIEQLNQAYETAGQKAQATPGKKFKVHAGMYAYQDGHGNMWRVFRLDDEMSGQWIAAEWGNDYGNYTDSFPTLSDVLEALEY